MLPSPHRAIRAWLATVLLALPSAPATEISTAQIYLSGHGPKDAVPWEFTVTGGRRAGEKTTILVPSNWEQQGFGTYNYGDEADGKGIPNADEHGLYRLRFTVPKGWEGRRVRIVFEGVMTDATVKINGLSAGPTHQGAFYRFRYDITPLVKFGAENLLEVDVAKQSANARTNAAERASDYWVFGGIFRPVYLEALPVQAIEHVSINARANGSFQADIEVSGTRDADRVQAQIFSADGKPADVPFSTPLPAVSPNEATRHVHLATQLAAPRLWTAETPNLYTVKVSLLRGDTALHTVTERFGFRTIEVRPGEGIFLNGQRILLKGVGRHSFRPETARALTTEDCYDDVRLIKEMNMNAVRMTHYPPDVAFLDACDELGLYVIDELSGWHHSHDTEVGKKLVREMVTRDVNHPSIFFWDNGNEGGWNTALDGEFAKSDPQGRLVLHPWTLMSGIDTTHYPSFVDLTKRLAGPNLVMPTEMLHGLYDGGAGAGLEDYWHAIASSPFGLGGFIWVFADEGILRTDENGRIDVHSTFAPDGIVGPHHEKEGSFFTARDLFCPVQIDPPKLDSEFPGQLTLHNRYEFTPLSACGFTWRLLRFADPDDATTSPQTLARGSATPPSIAPGATGELPLSLPTNWRASDALELTATDSTGRKLWTWTWPLPALAKRLANPKPAASSNPKVETIGTEVRLHAGAVTASFDAKTGLLRGFTSGDKTSPLTNGPRLVFARPPKGEIAWINGALDAASTWTLDAPQLLNVLEINLDYPKNVTWAGCKLEISPDGHHWQTLYDASRRPKDGNLYEFPPQVIAAVRLSKLEQSDGQTGKVKNLRAAYQAERFPAESPTPAKVTTGVNKGAAWLESSGAGGLDHFRWTLTSDGALHLDYAYTVSGEFTYLGVTFDLPEEDLKSMRWLGEGPFRVWQNRLRGTTLGVHEIARNDNQPGATWLYPEFQGCFAGFRWARLNTTRGPLIVTDGDSRTYLRVGTPRIGFPLTSPAFPAGDLSFLRAIPAMGSKFIPAEKTGPTSQPAKANGPDTGTLTFRLGEETR